jgi:hypothetical protein
MDSPKPSDDSAGTLTDAVDGDGSQLDAAAGKVEDAATNLDHMLEQGLDTAEQKLDDFLSGLDNFLGKF